MIHKRLILVLAAVMVLVGFVAGMLLQAAVISAAEPAASSVLWAKQCDGDRVVVLAGFLVRCVDDVPKDTPRPTPTRAPTEKPLDIEPRQTAQPCGDDPNYWTSCPPYPEPKP